MQSNVFSTNKTLNLGGRLLDLSEPRIMGILNVTPDSFYDGHRYTHEAEILQQAEKLLHEGAAIIDVGGYSSRPGASDVSPEEETRRVTLAIQVILKSFPEAFISVDTFRAGVARAAVAEGAVMVNDISGGDQDEDMYETIATLQVPYVLMHMRGTPQTMSSLTQYDYLIRDVISDLHPKIKALEGHGVKDIVIDPGFGFAKTREQNFELLKGLREFQIFGKPVMVGLSRKSMIWKTLDLQAEGALNGTTVLNTVALLNGASILRVHDVKEAVEAVKLITFVK